MVENRVSSTLSTSKESTENQFKWFKYIIFKNMIKYNEGLIYITLESVISLNIISTNQINYSI